MIKVSILKCDSIHPTPLIPWLIKLVEGTSFHHYAIEFKNYVIEAAPDGVVGCYKEDFSQKYKILDKFEIELQVSDQRIFNFYSFFMGKKYGFIQNIFILLKRLRLINKYPSWGTRGVTCSELVMLFFTEFYHIKPDVTNVGLREVEQFLEEIEDELPYNLFG